MSSAHLRKKEIKEELSNLESLKQQGIPIHYVRFHQAVPRFKNDEPVSEFYIKGPTGKYIVDSLLWIPGKCILFECKGELDSVESANIMYTRITQ